MTKIKIMSLNVRGIADTVKRRKIFNYCRNKEMDVICLQETHSTCETHHIWRSEWGVMPSLLMVSQMQEVCAYSSEKVLNSLLLKQHVIVKEGILLWT